MILLTENYKPSGTTQGSFEFKVCFKIDTTLHVFNKGNL